MLCTHCRKHESKPGRKRCQDCAARIAAAQWRWKQGQPKKARPRMVIPMNLATDPLIVSHVPLAKSFARRVVAKYRVLDWEDVFGNAAYGLVVAGRTFNESKGVTFAAWAIRVMRGIIFNELRKQWRRGHIAEQAA